MNEDVPAEAAARIGTDVDRLLRRIEDAARRTREGGDGEATHDVRVATRQFGALLDVWRAHLPARRRRRAARALARLRRALGPARERRVAIGSLRERLPSMPSELRAGLGVLIEGWDRALERFEREARGACRRGVLRRIRRRVERATAPLVNGSATAPHLIHEGRARVAERERRAIEQVRRSIATRTDRDLHAARVAIKRWRYGIDRLLAADPSAPAGHRETLVALQRTLGRINDLAALRDDLDPVPARLRAPGGMFGAEALRTVRAGLETERLAEVESFVRSVESSELVSDRVLPIDPSRRSAG